MVIPARNEQATLPRQLDALLAQEVDAEWEIIVVDNGSTDSTAETVTRLALEHPRLRLVHESRPGVCHARNAGVTAARSDALAFCDADDVVGAGWVSGMIDAVRSHPLVTGSQELDALNPAWLAGSRGRRLEGRPSSFHGLFSYPAGNNFGVRRDLFDRLGGFDQRFAGAEDVELALRARREGVDTTFVPDLVVHYAYRPTARELWRQAFGYGLHRPAIAKQLAASGEPGPSIFAGWRSWAWLILNCPRAISPHGRALLAWVAGNRIGHLVGSVRHRRVLL